MLVHIYGEKQMQEFGAERWEVEWQEVRPSAQNKKEIDPDTDLLWRQSFHTTQEKARTVAREVVDSYRTAYGVATVTLQRVDWFVEEDRIAEWQDVGTPEYVD